jgi:MFS family permease
MVLDKLLNAVVFAKRICVIVTEWLLGRQKRAFSQCPLLCGYGWYGYWVLLGAIMIEFAIGPGHSYGINSFIDNFISDLDLTRTELSSMWAGAMVVSSLLVFGVGWAVDEFGSLFVAMISAVLFSATLLGLGYATTPYALMPLLCTLRLFGPEALGICGRTAMNRWFVTTRGKACALKCVFENALLIQPVLFLHLIKQLGWRETYKSLAGCSLCVLAGAMLLLRDLPEKYGPPRRADTCLTGGGRRRGRCRSHGDLPGNRRRRVRPGH